MNSARDNQGFFSPFQGISSRVYLIWISGLILITLSLYEGNENFFLKHFSSGLEKGPLLDWYKYLYKHICSLVLFFIFPVLIIRFFLKENLSDFGLKLGDWKFGLTFCLIFMAAMIGPLYLGSRNPEFRNYYPLTSLANESPWLFFLWGLTYLPHYIGWEFIFRGYFGFGLKKELGAFQAIMVQVIITTLLHIGKPEGETWSTIVGGIVFGLLSYRTGSIIYPILIHFFLGMMNTFFAGLPN